MSADAPESGSRAMKRHRRSTSTAINTITPRTHGSCGAGSITPMPVESATPNYWAAGPGSSSRTWLALQVLGENLVQHLTQRELVIARLVCSQFNERLCGGVTHVDLQARGLAHDGRALETVDKLFPRLDSLCWAVSGRVAPLECAATSTYLARLQRIGAAGDQGPVAAAGTAAPPGGDAHPVLAGSQGASGAGTEREEIRGGEWVKLGLRATGLRHLTLEATSPPSSRGTAWPTAMPYWPFNLQELPTLSSLTLRGRAPDNVTAQGLSGMTGLTSLVIEPLPQEPALHHPEYVQRMGLRASALPHLCALRSLRHLSFHLEERLGSGAPGSPLTELGALTALTCLELHGVAVDAEVVQSLLANMPDLRRLAVCFNGPSGRLAERKDLVHWRRLRQVSLVLRGRQLEKDLPLMALALDGNLTDLHLRSCRVSPWSLSALTCLTALTELSWDRWTTDTPTANIAAAASSVAAALSAMRSAVQSAIPALSASGILSAAAASEATEPPLHGLGVTNLVGNSAVAFTAAAIVQPPPPAPEEGQAQPRRPRSAVLPRWAQAEAEAEMMAVGLRAAAVQLLEGLLRGGALQRLRLEIRGPGQDLYEELPRLAAVGGATSLRSLHLVGACPFQLASTGSLRCLALLTNLQELRVAVQGAGSTQPSSGSPLLRLSWLPPGLTSLELANCPLGCPEAEDPQPAGSQQHGGAAAGTAGGRARQSSCFGLVSLAAPALGSEKGGKRAGKRRNSSAMVGASSGFPSDPVAAAAADPEPGAQDCGCCPGAARGHQRLAALERLCLNGCAYGCSGHLQSALGGLPRLAHLELDTVPGLTTQRLQEALPQLTRLTSLSVCAMGNAQLSGAGLAAVGGLTELRRLRWHVGDLADSSWGPGAPVLDALRSLTRLAVLDLPTGAMWGTSFVFPVLPLCEVVWS